MFLTQLLSFIFIFGAVKGQCLSPNHRLISDLCYSIPNQKLNYENAQEYCHENLMNLAVIHNSAQDNFLSMFVRSQFGLSITNFWIGLSRQSDSFVYHWDDRTDLIWSNFDPYEIQDGYYVAEKTINGKWKNVDKNEQLPFVCSYDPNNLPVFSTLPTTVTTNTPITFPSVTCLFLYDTQSSGIDQSAIDTYQTYLTFAYLIASKLNEATVFSGTIDHFGYSDELALHDIYQTYLFEQFNEFALDLDADSDSIDLDLKDADSTLATAIWINTESLDVIRNTCLVFVSAAPVDEYGGTTIQTSYNSFKTVVGVLVGGATSIPGLTNVVTALNLDDSDAQNVVDQILQNI